MTGILNCPARAALDPVRRTAPRLVLGLGRSGLADAVARHFESLGWDVTHTQTGTDAGKLAHRARPTAVVLATQLQGESGLLTCAKVRLTRPHVRVVLVGPDDDTLARHARYAGAVGYLPDSVGVAAVARAVLGN